MNSPAKALTTREDEILELLAKGLRNHEIGSVLGITVETVKTHVKSVFRKLGVTDRVEAVREAISRGFIHDQRGAPWAGCDCSKKMLF